MLRRRDDEIPEREISLWLEREGIPPERYRNLQPHGKVVLRNLVRMPTRPTTTRERKELYKNLCLPYLVGKDSIDPVDFMPDEKIREFFNPVAPSETLYDHEKY